MKLDYRYYYNAEEFDIAFEHYWREWLSNLPDVSMLSHEERERFKRFTKKVIKHLNGLEPTNSKADCGRG